MKKKYCVEIEIRLVHQIGGLRGTPYTVPVRQDNATVPSSKTPPKRVKTRDDKYDDHTQMTTRIPMMKQGGFFFL